MNTAAEMLRSKFRSKLAKTKDFDDRQALMSILSLSDSDLIRFRDMIVSGAADALRKTER